MTPSVDLAASKFGQYIETGLGFVSLPWDVPRHSGRQTASTRGKRNRTGRRRLPFKGSSGVLSGMRRTGREVRVPSSRNGRGVRALLSDALEEKTLKGWQLYLSVRFLALS